MSLVLVVVYRDVYSVSIRVYTPLNTPNCIGNCIPNRIPNYSHFYIPNVPF